MIFGRGPVPRMGIRGAAWATGLGQLLTLAAYLLFAWIRPLPIRISLKSLKFDLILLKKIYTVGIPATLNMALSSLLISSLNAILAVYGQMYVMILGAVSYTHPSHGFDSAVQDTHLFIVDPFPNHGHSCRHGNRRKEIQGTVNGFSFDLCIQ